MPILFAHFITEIDNYSTEIKKKKGTNQVEEKKVNSD